MSSQAILRISKELGELQRESDLSLAVACKDSDVQEVRALIVGPADTPYEFGFYEFQFTFPPEYPRKEPKVTALTTNKGRTRFNPNIYANGRVCLSILGTWRGEKGEEWSAAQGLESVLLSIQSLMSNNPYENEPGFEDANNRDGKEQDRYREKIRHESLRVSVIHRLERYLDLRGEDPGLLVPAATKKRMLSDLYAGTPADGVEPEVEVRSDEPPLPSETGPGPLGPATEEPSAAPPDPVLGNGKAKVPPYEPFKDLCKTRFLWYHDAYVETIAKGAKSKRVGKSFKRMPFETGSNSMTGKYNYPSLNTRLRAIKAALDAETAAWAVDGLAAQAEGTTMAVRLQRQYEQTVAQYKVDGAPHNLELDGGNPFVWLLTYIGAAGTPLDGGLFHIRVALSPRFPQEQPRVRVLTKIFHHRVAADGTVCYTVPMARREDVQNHLAAVLCVLEDANPAYDPRTMVNPEAHRLLWGTPDERKLYQRRLRRSVQDSLEVF